VFVAGPGSPAISRLIGKPCRGVAGSRETTL